MSQIIFGNSEEKLQDIPDSSIDLCITSPPYKEEDGFSLEVLYNIFEQVYRVQKNNSLLFLNFGHLNNFKARGFRIALMLMDCFGYKLKDTITWVKKQYTPLRGKNLDNVSEFIFLLYKGKQANIDPYAIGEPYKDKSNIGRYGKGKDLKSGSNVWNIGYDTINNRGQKLHKDRFPLELPIKCIKLANISPNSTILDPFAGSFTTAMAAQKMGHNYVAIEKSKKYFNIGEQRLLKEEIK